ncbi:MAG TPA: hypothetical protein VMU79_12420 [Casimicrobiaceae bacterium]|jgi:hypothetical protein|nr:hypothetical protein [Casimicrobiaceae bacterium]
MLRRLMTSEAPNLHPARALLGWLSDKQARSALTSQRRNVELTDEQRRSVEAARAAVAARASFRAPSPILGPCPEILRAHGVALYAHERFRTFRDEGWQIAMVDLTRVCVVQHTVSGESNPMIEGVDPDDLSALARITLPIPNEQPLSYQVDSQRNVAVLSSLNGNLSIAGFAAQQVARGTLMGFIVDIAASYLQVAEIGGRFVLRDGNHRAASLVRQGITRVPALFRALTHGEDLAVPKSALSAATYLGEKPPTPLDYWDPAVSASVLVPRRRKFVLIQGLEQSLAE